MIYVISYYDYEDTTHYLLKHETSYSREEFKEICIKAKKEAYAILLARSKAFERTHWKRLVSVHYDDLAEETNKILINEYGFEQLNALEFDIHDDSTIKTPLL